MKKLVTLHRDAVLQHTHLDFDRIQQLTYLYEFDREVQYVCSLNLGTYVGEHPLIERVM